MKHFLSVLALVACFSVVSAQSQVPTTPKAAKSEATMERVRKVDFLIQVLPLNLKKAQIDRVLTAIEKARDRERQVRIAEDDELAKVDEKLAAAVKEGIDKGVYPSRDLQQEVAKMFRTMALRRSIILNEMVDTFYQDVKNVLEPGQKTVMEKSLDAAALEPGLDVAKMDSEAKIKFFIKKIFMDSIAYDTLRELQKAVKE